MNLENLKNYTWFLTSRRFLYSPFNFVILFCSPGEREKEKRGERVSLFGYGDTLAGLKYPAHITRTHIIRGTMPGVSAGDVFDLLSPYYPFSTILSTKERKARISPMV